MARRLPWSPTPHGPQCPIKTHAGFAHTDSHIHDVGNGAGLMTLPMAAVGLAATVIYLQATGDARFAGAWFGAQPAGFGRSIW